MDLREYILKQVAWSAETFGPGTRTKGLIEHIKSELEEIKDNPKDITEWVDVIILGLDGAWRSGHSAEEICDALLKKASKNRERKWPEPSSEDEPVYHIKTGEK